MNTQKQGDAIALNYAMYEYKTFANKTKSKIIRFGVVSDTHLCSNYQQLTHLKDTYKFFHEKGAEFVLHCGDLTDGEKVYRGHDYETFIIGADDTVDYVVKKYPNSLPTYVISGNHDLSWFLKSGVDIVKNICEKRSDFTYLGQMGAYIMVNNVKIYMVHGLGSPAYAISYKSQKLVEGFSSENKPNMLFVGHFHSNFCAFMRNIFVCHPGSFQGQTPMLRRLAIFPVIGGYLVEIEINKTGFVRFRYEFLPCFNPKFKDI